MPKMNGFLSFAAQRVVVGILAAVAVLFLIFMTISFLTEPSTDKTAQKSTVRQPAVQQTENKHVTPASHELTQPDAADTHTATAAHDQNTSWKEQFNTLQGKPEPDNTHQVPAPSHTVKVPESHDTPALQHVSEDTMLHSQSAASIKGVTFVESIIEPMQYELRERFWGWRPNDLIKFTDNVNNFQLGVLEVVRRTTMVLSDSISRTGSTASLDPNIEEAINCFMIRADKFWFPSAESKYKDGIKELETYKNKLMLGQANFYIRSDNLIPLLATFQQLLGSCDQNLVKTKEENGDRVSSFQADDYFYYSKGVAHAMEAILKAVAVDFHRMIVSRNGEESLHHAIMSCEKAASLKPFIVLESSLSGFLANHRANMATSISHARFYLDVLQETLST